MTSAQSTDGIGISMPGDDDPTIHLGDTLRLIGMTVAALAVLIAVLTDWSSPVRAALTLAFLLFVPGLALTELLEIRDPVQRLALATAASLAVETLVAVALLYAGLFSAEAVIAVVVGITCFAVLGALLRRGHGAGGPAAGLESRGVAT